VGRQIVVGSLVAALRLTALERMALATGAARRWPSRPRSSPCTADGKRKVRTGCTREERQRAQEKLSGHIAKKYKPSRAGDSHPSQILVVDVLNIYNNDIAVASARTLEMRPKKTV
jgi:hypothetical protein